MLSAESTWSFAKMGPHPLPTIQDPKQAAAHKRRLCSSMDEDEDAAEEEMAEEEWQCHERLHHEGEKKRRLTSEQVKFLEHSFEMEKKLEPDRKLLIAKHLQLQPRQVAVWFQNRRARWKTKQVEHDFDALKASYDAVVEENKQLRAQIIALSALLNGSSAKKSAIVQHTIAAVLPASPTSYQQTAGKAQLISPKSEANSPTKSDESEVADSSSDVPASQPSLLLRMIEEPSSSFYSEEGLLESLCDPVLLQETVVTKVEKNLIQEENCDPFFRWEEPGLFGWYD